jgi:hypothetical protein
MVATAYYRFEVGVIKRSSGHSAVAKAAYNAGVKIYDERLGETFNFSHKQDVYHTEILASANAPAWVYDRSELWNRIEAAEKRKDSQVARHFVLSLPNFMSDQEKVAVTKSFLHQECIWRGMVADIAWHDFTGKNQHNPHAHVMLSMRVLNRDGFGKKNRDWNQKQLLLSWREKWAQHLNRQLAKSGYQQRVDHRSYKDQGIDLIPTVHEGASHSALRRDRISTHLTAHNDKIRQERAEIAKLEAELAELRKQQENQKRKPDRLAIERKQLQEGDRQPEQHLKQQSSLEECRRALRSFQRVRSSSQKRYQQEDDSRLDWVTLKRLAKRGYSIPALEFALANGSPDLERRKKGLIRDYVRRTVQNVTRSPDVRAAQERRSQRPTEHQPKPSQPREQYPTQTPTATQAKQERKMGWSERKSYDLADKAIADPMIDLAQIPVHALGSLDEKSVAWIIAQAQKSEAAQKQFKNARWTAKEDTRFWQDQCRAEYLKELGRYLEVKGAEGYSPYTDVEITTKLRMAGFGKNRIYDTIRNNSPFISFVDPDAKTRYIAKGIAPLANNPKANQRIWQWNQFRVAQALEMPEDKREAYLKEHRLDRLNLSLTKERWAEQKQQHQPVLPTPKHQERDR